MLLDGGGGSTGGGKGPLKPRPKAKSSSSSILEEAMHRPAVTPARAQPAAPAKSTNPLDDFLRPQGSPSVVDYKTIAEDQRANTQGTWLLGQGEAKLKQQQADAAAEAEEKRAEREKVLGITTGALTTTPEMLKDQLHQLTDDEYAHLSPKQRAAVDFNSMLATAVRKDLKRQDRYKNVPEQARATYDESVKNMFGKEGGSELYAPETMAVLRQLKIEDPTDDLDDYLGMKVAITEKDLTNITEKQPVPNYVIDGRAPEEDRGKLEVVQGLVDKTAELEQSLAKGKAMLQSFQATAASERAEDLGHLGGSSPLASRPSLGYRPAQFTETGAPADLNTYFRTMFDSLSDEKQAENRPHLLEALKNDLYPDELDAFMSYADARTRNSREYGALMGDNPEAQYTSPKEFRRLLGLDK